MRTAHYDLQEKTFVDFTQQYFQGCEEIYTSSQCFSFNSYMT